jgi:hypothetical protein
MYVYEDSENKRKLKGKEKSSSGGGESCGIFLRVIQGTWGTSGPDEIPLAKRMKV